MNESRANKALGSLTTDESTTDATNKIIEVKKEDVDVIMAELEVTDDEATSALRAAEEDNEKYGDASIKGQQLIAAALRRLVTQSI